MSRLQAIEHSDHPTIQKIFDEIHNAYGMVPNVFRTYAHNEAVLAANWLRVKRVMLEGVLQRRLKEAIAVVVSRDNGCDYCVRHHGAALQQLGLSSEQVEALSDADAPGNFDARDRALLGLARQANRDHRAVRDSQLEKARQAGASPAEIVEALAVMETFAGMNRFIETLDVEWP